MEITHNNMLPGMLNDEVEFFAVAHDMVRAIHRMGIRKFDNLSPFIYQVLRKAMQNPDATIQEMECFAYENCGGLDTTPDIDMHGDMNFGEYIPEANTLPLSNGRSLTYAQMRVLKLSAYPDKIIADKLCLSKTTVESHWQDIRDKTGLNNKTELAIFATKMGVI